MSTFKHGSITDLAERAWSKSQNEKISPSKALRLIWSTDFDAHQRAKFRAIIRQKRAEQKQSKPPKDAVKHAKRHEKISQG